MIEKGKGENLSPELKSTYYDMCVDWAENDKEVNKYLDEIGKELVKDLNNRYDRKKNPVEYEEAVIRYTKVYHDISWKAVETLYEQVLDEAEKQVEHGYLIRYGGLNMTYEENDYLVHYGVKGQKWGVRNYQNPDGTLTAEGRQRYAGQVDRGDRGLLKKWTIGSNAGTYAFAKWRGRRHDKNISKINQKYNNKIAKNKNAIAEMKKGAKNDTKNKAFLDDAAQATKEHINKLEAKRDKKLVKYESKRQAQGAANADMDAYRRHRSTASLMLTTAGYKHARARGAGRGRAFVEGFVPVAGLGLRMAGDKKRYGKRIVFGAPNDNEYDAMAMDRD